MDDFDVVIIGAGIAGMTAAIVAASEGKRPVIIEKSDLVGGTAAYAIGAVWIPNSALAASLGFDDSAERAATYLANTVGDHATPELQDTYLTRGSEAVDYLIAHSRFRVTPIGYPDYIEAAGAAVGGRFLLPDAFDGRKLGRNLSHLRPPLPQFSIFKGLQVAEDEVAHFMAVGKSLKSTVHVAKRLLRYARDRVLFGRSTDLLYGNALCAQLYASVLQRDIPILYLTSAEKIILEGGLISAVEVKSAQGIVRTIATSNVIVATGGFPRDPDLTKEHFRQPYDQWTLAAENANGSGLRLCLSAGARLDEGNVDTAFYAPFSTYVAPDGQSAFWPHFTFDRAKPGLIAVDSNGNRFTNEANSYHQFGKAMYDKDAIPAYLICDRSFMKRYGLGNIKPGGQMPLSRAIRTGYISEAASVAELAYTIGVDGDRLNYHISRMNGFSRLGTDEDFGKGSTYYNRFLGDPTNSPNPCLGTIDEPPFYALKVVPGNIGSSRGIVTDTFARALDAEDSPIPGLYVCGNDMNSPVGGSYIGAGITLGPSITFAYIAAMHASGNARPAPAAA